MQLFTCLYLSLYAVPVSLCVYICIYICTYVPGILLPRVLNYLRITLKFTADVRSGCCVQSEDFRTSDCGNICISCVAYCMYVWTYVQTLMLTYIHEHVYLPTYMYFHSANRWCTGRVCARCVLHWHMYWSVPCELICVHTHVYTNIAIYEHTYTYIRTCMYVWSYTVVVSWCS